MATNSFFYKNRDLFTFVALCAAVLAIYWQTGGFGFVNLDDNLYVYNNPAVLSGLNWESVKWAFTSFHSANWHPLTWLSLMLDVQLFGRSAGAHHVVNVFFHLLNSILAFAVFRRLTGCFWKSAIVAMLFAVHPTHVESVAWISERKDVLSTLFWLLTMLAYAVYVEKDGSELDGDAERTFGDLIARRLTSPRFGMVAALFALGLMAKPMLVTLPFVLLLLDFWPLSRWRTLSDAKLLIIEKLPLIALTVASAWITVVAQRSVGAVETLVFLPFGTRVMNALTAFAKYVAMLFYPAKLAIWYPYEREIPVLTIAFSVVFLIGITAFCIWQFRSRKYLLFGWLWFLGTLVPVIGIVQVGSQSMADRYTYVPYFGLFVMLVWGIGDLLKKIGAGTIVFAGLFAAASIALGYLAFVQTTHWRNSESVYRHALEVTGDNFLVTLNLCTYFLVDDRADDAGPFCAESVRINPNFADSQNALGIYHLKKGKYPEAEANFLRALELVPGNLLARLNLVAAQAIQRRPAEAEQNLETLAPEAGRGLPATAFIEPLNNLARAWADQGNYEKAAENLTRILALDPNNAPARGNLALMFLNLKRYEEAQKLIESAIQLSPKEAAGYNTYGLILMAQDRRLEAKGMFEKALELKPDAPDIQANLKKATEK